MFHILRNILVLIITFQISGNYILHCEVHFYVNIQVVNIISHPKAMYIYISITHKQIKSRAPYRKTLSVNRPQMNLTRYIYIYLRAVRHDVSISSPQLSGATFSHPRLNTLLVPVGAAHRARYSRQNRNTTQHIYIY